MIHLKTPFAFLLTSKILRRFVSHKLRQPISVDMYQPLKVVAVNCMPPTSNNMLETAGKAYQRKPNSLNQSYLQQKWNKKHKKKLKKVCEKKLKTQKCRF